MQSENSVFYTSSNSRILKCIVAGLNTQENKLLQGLLKDLCYISLGTIASLCSGGGGEGGLLVVSAIQQQVRLTVTVFGRILHPVGEYFGLWPQLCLCLGLLKTKKTTKILTSVLCGDKVCLKLALIYSETNNVRH